MKSGYLNSAFGIEDTLAETLPVHSLKQVEQERHQANDAESATEYFPFLIARLKAEGLQIVREDVHFVEGLMPNEKGAQRDLLAQYRKVWLEAMDATPAEHQRQNAGRHAANTWLRERRTVIRNAVDD